MALEQKALAGLIIEVVRRLKRDTRTKLVKLIYLVDERYFRLYGRAVLGLDYQFDKFGPNVVGNETVKDADLLHGYELRMERRLWLLRNQFTYTTGAQPRFPISLTRPALELVGEILAEYGAMLGEKIVAASQATRPFAANPEKGDPLRMVTLREDARERIAEIRETSVSSRPSATTSLTPTRIPHW